jgi:cellulose synthase/poly-beta-1,6-N-acetylglucosamine synthase-like glycosyltransferase
LVIYAVFRFGFALVFLGLHCALWIGLLREWRRDRRFFPADPPGQTGAGSPPSPGAAGVAVRVSVIVPVRNEAARLPGLLESLARQDYPAAEYIFIDDGSTDESGELLRRFREGRMGVTLIRLEENPGPNRKQFALCRGIEAASGELYLFTDADCEVPPRWIEAMVRRMEDPRTGVTLGPVFKKSDGKSFFHLYQCFDHAIRYLYLAASTGLGAAGGGFGNNLILRRETLEVVGGYDRVPPSPTEDAALVSLIRGASDYGVRTACGSDVPVMTRGEQSWKALINQTLRWNNGGLFSPDMTTRLNFRFLMVTISMGILAIPFLPLVPSLWPLPAAVLLAMTGNSIAALGIFGGSLPRAGAAYVIQTIFTPIYFTLLTVLGFCRVKPDWKGDPV